MPARRGGESEWDSDVGHLQMPQPLVTYKCCPGMHAVTMSHAAQCSPARHWKIPGFCTKMSTQLFLSTAEYTRVERKAGFLQTDRETHEDGGNRKMEWRQEGIIDLGGSCSLGHGQQHQSDPGKSVERSGGRPASALIPWPSEQPYKKHMSSMTTLWLSYSETGGSSRRVEFDLDSVIKSDTHKWIVMRGRAR